MSVQAREADERAIAAVLVRFCRGIDRCDEELVRSCYHEDSFHDHGLFKGTGAEFAAEAIPRHRAKPIKQHALTNIAIDVRGATAFAESYVMLRTTAPDTGAPLIGFGRFIDRFERRDGEWRIAQRLVTVESDVTEGFPSKGFVQATQDRSDPSYER